MMCEEGAKARPSCLSYIPIDLGVGGGTDSCYGSNHNACAHVRMNIDGKLLLLQ